MKRSEVNEIIRQSDAFIRSFGFALPPFAYWSPEKMRTPAASDIRARGLGWDITDYGQGKFADLGLFLFTVRNGLLSDLRAGGGNRFWHHALDRCSRANRHEDGCFNDAICGCQLPPAGLAIGGLQVKAKFGN